MFTSGTSSSQEIEKKWMTTLVLDGLARQRPMKILKLWRKLLWRIVESLLDKFLRMSAYFTIFFDYHGVVHQEFLPHGHTVNKEYYLEIMRRLLEAMRKKRPESWKNNSWLLHHDNAPVHSSLLVRNFLAKNTTLIMTQPRYSSDLAPRDLFPVSKIKETHERTAFCYDWGDKNRISERA